MDDALYVAEAHYIGGDLDAIEYIAYPGRLWLSQDGFIRFSIEWFDGRDATETLMSGRGGEWRDMTAVAPEDLVSIGDGGVDQFNTLKRTAVGHAMLGDLGATIGAATSIENARLLIAFQRDGITHAAIFGVNEADQVRYLDTVRRWRRDAGLHLAADGSTIRTDAASPPQSSPGAEDVLVEVRDLLREIRDLLRREG